MRKSTRFYDLKNGYGINCYQDFDTISGNTTYKIEVIMTNLSWSEQVEYYEGKEPTEANSVFKELYAKYAIRR